MSSIDQKYLIYITCRNMEVVILMHKNMYKYFIDVILCFNIAKIKNYNK